MAKTKQSGAARKLTLARTAASAKKAVGTGKKGVDEQGGALDRRNKQERRATDERRQEDEPVATERRALVRREKVSRRRQIDPTTCERDYTQEEIEFMSALDHYKRTSGRMFPTCSEILEVFKALGYEKRGPSQPATFEATNDPDANRTSENA